MDILSKKPRTEYVTDDVSDIKKKTEAIVAKHPVGTVGVTRKGTPFSHTKGDMSEIAQKEVTSAPVKKTIVSAPVEQPVPYIANNPKAKEAPKEIKSSGVDLDWGTILAGATPALTGLLIGEQEAGWNVGGDNLYKMYEDKREDDKIQAKANAKAKEGTLKKSDVDTVYDNLLKRDVIVPIEEINNNRSRYMPPRGLEKLGAQASLKEKFDERQGKFNKTIEDEFGNKTNVDNRKLGKLLEKSGLSITQRQEMTKRVAKYNTNMKTVDADLLKAQKASNAIGKGRLGEKLGVMGLVKDIETRLSDQDRAFYAYELGFLRQVKQKIDLNKTGKLPAEVVAESKQILKSAIKAMKRYKSFKKQDAMNELKNTWEISEESSKGSFPGEFDVREVSGNAPSEEDIMKMSEEQLKQYLGK